MKVTQPRGPGRGGWAWRQARKHVLERDGYRCQLRLPGCTGRAVAVDHVVPLSRIRGLDPASYRQIALDPQNLRAACTHCNSTRGAGRRPKVVRVVSSRW